MCRFTILNTVLVTKPSDLLELVNSESRVMLLYSTREEATHILSAARDYKITGENYVWVVTQSVIENLQTPYQFPVGMLGKDVNLVCSTVRYKYLNRHISIMTVSTGCRIPNPFRC
ncbi:Glutamate receptor ionotropic, NMDA 2B [Homalodisca vitripennis]|nr:Glutamate receptor ionotropic, NMDA 2B [Homalodisca vitripennis]